MAETKPSLQPWTRFFNLLKVDRQEVINIYIYAIFNGIVSLSLPLGIQAIINLIIGGQISTTWIILIIFVLSGVVISGILQILQLYMTENLQQKIFTRGAFEFTFRIPKLKLDLLDKVYVPELVNRFFDINTVQKGLSKILIDFSTASLQVFLGLVLLSFYHPFFIIYGVVLIILVVLIIRFTGPKGLATSLKESSYKYEVVHWLEEIARTIETFKMAGNTNLPFEKTDKAVTGYLNNRKEHFKILIYQYSVMILFKVFITAGLLILGGLLVIDQQMNVGQFVAAEIIILLVIASVEKLILSMETIYDVLTAIEKIGTVTDLEMETSDNTICEVKDFSHGMNLSIKNLSYKFAGSKFDILKDINLDFKSGEKICVTGYDGSGKSMFFRILAGYFDEFRGNILINGIPYVNFDRDELRSMISYSQTKEDTIFSGTLAENISLGRQHVKFEDVKFSADLFGLLRFFDVFPRGYNTLLTPEGKQLPKSIILKIMLARAIASKPKVLIMEDLLSRLKSLDKEAFLNHVLEKNNKMTVIMVTNEREIAQKCDKIIRFDSGEVADIGTYDELKNESWFSILFNQ
ncbi:MAG: ATP-binding cassette domain-containing protein [Candidatus Kapabacteria bacterium]|nr:ATP-binding cassette domain-containing protein [Ignavibacteriota bacterium]MCW5885107.1 ATP-binding cassette domain-containing protein [Candidatus Kapabacteria bacterium]